MSRKSCVIMDSVDKLWEQMKEDARSEITYFKERTLKKQKKKVNLKKTCISSSKHLNSFSIDDKEMEMNDHDYRGHSFEPQDTFFVDDSDDENDDCIYEENKVFHNTDKKHKLRFYITSLQSKNIVDRIQSLTELHKEIEYLLQDLSNVNCGDLTQSPHVPTRMNFPPPLDINRIVLTYKYNDNMVSDLAKGMHVPRWAQWERTHSSLLSQFKSISIDTNEKDMKEENEISLSLESSTDCIKYIKSDDPLMKLRAIWQVCAISLFRKFTDSSEKCRELAFSCVLKLLQCTQNMIRQIPYLITSLVSRYPSSDYDEYLNIFVHDKEQNDFFKRGGATERQDRINLIHKNTYPIYTTEKSEEIRLLQCKVFSALIRSSVHTRTLPTLNPYFSDIILALHSHILDPYPDLIVEAANLLVQILRIPDWEKGSKYYAIGIARACISNLRHRNARVRIASLSLFEASVCVPNREKVKGAGSEAIADLVGFRQENVLPIAAFYSREYQVTINCLAELTYDKNTLVRSRCCSMISFFMVCLPDRYDHHQRLLPYLLSFFNDNAKEIQEMALAAIENCGQQYEAEHPEEIIERRQYGVDGDNRCNYGGPLPSPFKERPALGSRLFVRSNTKRFFSALLTELTSWISQTRDRCCELLIILIVYCEEHLTMDFHETFQLLIKALEYARNDDDENARERLLVSFGQIFELIGRFVDPDTYVPMALARLGNGDANVITTSSEDGFHSANTKAAYAFALKALQKGSKWKRLAKHCANIIVTLCSNECISLCVGTIVKLECMSALICIIERIYNDNIGSNICHKSMDCMKKSLIFCLSSLESIMTMETHEETKKIAQKCQMSIQKIIN